jgi:very-short-patch-repair endonuclease
MRGENRMKQVVIAEIARVHHGVVTRRQLVDAGLSDLDVDRRLANGQLLGVHRGVFRVGHVAWSVEAEYYAAVVACGDRALLRQSSAAHLLDISRRRPSRPQVLAPTERRVSGIDSYRQRLIHPADRFEWRAIPVTSVAATIVDLASTLSLDELARAFHKAEVRHGLRPAAVAEVLARRPSAKGIANLRAVIEGDADIVLSKLERRFLQLLRAERLPLPKTNKRFSRGYVDCHWRDHRLVVELDSYRFHHSRHAWKQDHEREQEARRAGYGFRRYTWDDVFVDSSWMLEELSALLVPSPVVLARPRKTR